MVGKVDGRLVGLVGRPIGSGGSPVGKVGDILALTTPIMTRGDQVGRQRLAVTAHILPRLDQVGLKRLALTALTQAPVTALSRPHLTVCRSGVA